MAKRSCGDCTKCCEGWLAGEALGKNFYQGRPCHFVAIGKGCTVYAKRPKDPCQTYKCAWIQNEDIPEWMKPSDIDTIIDYREVDGIPYINVKEAGSVLSAKVLTWLVKYALEKKENIYWEVNGGKNWFGSSEFVTAMNAKSTS